ncbi:MAG TPA: RsmG family class I SAM-dependent methyltransferase [Gaiellaceae bacterium]|nr:RsmG family class I SAM-dependent methyltransferase [Gaiellaceae bacterium]
MPGWARRPRARSRTATSSSYLSDWLDAVLATPGLTALRDAGRAREMLLDDALRALPLLDRYDGPLIDVGSGGGSPGIPLAAVLPEREVTLLDAEQRKCDFLRRWAPPNASVVWGRAEEQAPGRWGVATAKALAQPPVAAELCLPLVRKGGAVILWLGESADLDRLEVVSEQVGGGVPVPQDGLVVLPKVAPTPPGFPRRAGVAKKRPLA